MTAHRHPRVHRPRVADRLVEVFGERASLLAGARRVGGQIAVLPVLSTCSGSASLLWISARDCCRRVRGSGSERYGKGAVMPSRPRLLRAGDLVRFDGRLHTVAALEGTAVRLVDESQLPSVVLLADLLSSAGFEVVTPSSVRAAVPAAGVLGFPLKAVERAEWWQRHLVQMLTGRPMEDPHGRVRAAYDPAVRSLRQRELTKAAELEAGGHPASLKLIQRIRGRFEREGVLGLVDPRLRSVSDGTGRVDRRVVEALRKVVEDQTSRSTASAQVLRRRMERALEAEHGPGVVALPSRTTFYRLLSALSSGRHTLGSARTRRSLAKQPDGMFGQLTVVRPGEVMEIDSTPLDVLVVHDDGTVDTVELTGIADIATRTLAAAVLRPSTKTEDAALLLARAMTPEPMRPGWADALRMSRSVLPHASLIALDERLANAAAVPVITPETIVCDRAWPTSPTRDWDHARRILAERGSDRATEEEIAQTAVAPLDQAADGPDSPQVAPPGRSRRQRKVAARTRATAQPSWPRPAVEPHAEATVISSSCVDTPCFGSGRKLSPCGAGRWAGIRRQGGFRCRDPQV
ncbi:hypothetical protein [Streptomyces finlayi]|uniref:hypothetical protein n=1 Tax=Streptomyces finlayi TaxID=67296 RepID=UPI00162936B5|nr:hypothetical protein [Streptomyces finlayi]